MSTAPIRSMPELIEALRSRAAELQITHETIDAVSGLQSGYTSKLFAPKPIKNLGPMSFEAILGALGLAVVVVEDPKQVELVKDRWVKRRKPPVPAPIQSALRIEHQVPQEIVVTPALERLLKNPNWMKEIGAQGGKSRWAKLSSKQRAKVARKAVRARWRKARKSRRERAPKAPKTAVGFTDLGRVVSGPPHETRTG
jgi:hypothetical protein